MFVIRGLRANVDQGVQAIHFRSDIYSTVRTSNQFSGSCFRPK